MERKSKNPVAGATFEGISKGMQTEWYSSGSGENDGNPGDADREGIADKRQVPGDDSLYVVP